MNKKYLVWSGWIRSKSDKEIHYVGARQVAMLYQVNPSECIFITEGTLINRETGLPYGMREDNLISLRPDNSGRYQLPKGAAH